MATTARAGAESVSSLGKCAVIDDCGRYDETGRVSAGAVVTALIWLVRDVQAEEEWPEMDVNVALSIHTIHGWMRASVPPSNRGYSSGGAFLSDDADARRWRAQRADAAGGRCRGEIPEDRTVLARPAR